LPGVNVAAADFACSEKKMTMPAKKTADEEIVATYCGWAGLTFF
jgi:hypothetical protein